MCALFGLSSNPCCTFEYGVEGFVESTSIVMMRPQKSNVDSDYISHNNSMKQKYKHFAAMHTLEYCMDDTDELQRLQSQQQSKHSKDIYFVEEN